MECLKTDVLVVGGGTGGTAAAIQAARRGVNVILVSEFSWLGGMLSAAGVSAPDGNELLAFQTGLWGAFLQELQRRQVGGLDHAWVSFFTYEPAIAAAIFADWVRSLPKLHWIAGQTPQEVLRQGDRVMGVRFESCLVEAKVTLDGTELGDLLVLGEVPYRWGWEWRAEFGEPSAPEHPNQLTDCYPVQTPTWVVVMQDNGAANQAAKIPAPDGVSFCDFEPVFEQYEPLDFMNYGRLPGNRFMINWPNHGNDYGRDLNRLIQSAEQRLAFFQDAMRYSQAFAHFIQQHLGDRYGLANDTFPTGASPLGGGAFALHPYFRESRRLVGLSTVREQDILPQQGGCVAPLPVNDEGIVEAIAFGNYANDHHYPNMTLPLRSKSIRWGGRWTGTPFALPYRCLVPSTVTGLLVCEKNISVSHIANGATRLQPVVLGIGQAAGMAAALCVEAGCDPAALPVQRLQDALLTDPVAPAALVPCWNLPPQHPEWLHWQRYYLRHPEAYPQHGNAAIARPCSTQISAPPAWEFQGTFRYRGVQDYALEVTHPQELRGKTLQLVTLDAAVNEVMQSLPNNIPLKLGGRFNPAGNWLKVDNISSLSRSS